ncbi:metallophosphoesterase family protein [Campylobacter concisus]|jgi:ser/thr protein phosphatase family protein|uniref:metallophosphoesterase family protein n=1 Tax=Campylobacter concisus TaxID=199 RepID=UPI0011E628E7|nr:metallophosphoesterase family protein [Campylobacter concisus]
MKIALISDVHSNFLYLQKVLEHIDSCGATQVYCLGDLIGYYDEPNQVIDVIRKRNITCIKGNHEKYLLGDLEYNSDKEIIYGFKKQKQEITKDNFNFLKTLKDEIVLEISNKKIYMTHSLPGNIESYLYDIGMIDSNFLKYCDYYCFGHTHIPSILYKNGTCVINPGSVGQPRDYTKQSSYAIIDFQKNNVLIQKVDQDYEFFSKKMICCGYHSSLIKILKRDKNES